MQDHGQHEQAGTDRGKTRSASDSSGTLEEEEIDCRQYGTMVELERNIEDFIERYYNQVRLHAAAGLLASPVEFEFQQIGIEARPGLSGLPAAVLGFRRHPGDLSRCCFKEVERSAPLMSNVCRKQGRAASNAYSPALIGMSLRQDNPGGLLSSRARFRFSCRDHSETKKPRCQEKRGERRSTVPFGRVSKLDTVHWTVPEAPSPKRRKETPFVAI